MVEGRSVVNQCLEFGYRFVMEIVLQFGSLSVTPHGPCHRTVAEFHLRRPDSWGGGGGGGGGGMGGGVKMKLINIIGSEFFLEKPGSV